MNKILIIIITSLLIACTNNEEKKRIHLEKIEVGKLLKVDYLNDHLETLKEELRNAKQEYNQINEFQIGRSYSTKRKQLFDQEEIIGRIENSIQKTEKEISLTGLFQSFEFQKTPEGTINHIFQAAQYADYSKMRHLMDPYGECNANIFKMCMIEMRDEEFQKNWSALFSKGRIMKKRRETDNEADIEIAIGPNSSQLVVIRLVKRLDNWYLKEG